MRVGWPGANFVLGLLRPMIRWRMVRWSRVCLWVRTTRRVLVGGSLFEVFGLCGLAGTLDAIYESYLDLLLESQRLRVDNSKESDDILGLRRKRALLCMHSEGLRRLSTGRAHQAIRMSKRFAVIARQTRPQLQVLMSLSPTSSILLIKLLLYFERPAPTHTNHSNSAQITITRVPSQLPPRTAVHIVRKPKVRWHLCSPSSSRLRHSSSERRRNAITPTATSPRSTGNVAQERTSAAD